MKRTALAADPECRGHRTPAGHLENPGRFDAAVRGVAGLDLTPLPAREATEDELALAHSRRYIKTAEREIRGGFESLSTGDTDVSETSFDVARHAVGAVLNAVDSVAGGAVDNAFCIVRPPGHHATPDRGMGFCIFNNIAIGARYAQAQYGVRRVLILDWDVHHGNGTQDIFYSDDSVLFFSTHQYPWYPGTGADYETGDDKGMGKTINCPLPAGSGRKQVLGAFEERLLPAAHEFMPEMVMISAGFDSREGDPLGRFVLTDRDFADLTGVAMEIADKHCGGKVISVLEGGYNLDGLRSAIRAHVQTLNGEV